MQGRDRRAHKCTRSRWRADQEQQRPPHLYTSTSLAKPGASSTLPTYTQPDVSLHPCLNPCLQPTRAPPHLYTSTFLAMPLASSIPFSASGRHPASSRTL